MASVSELPSLFQALHLNPDSVRAVQAPVAPVEKKDLPRLMELGLVDSTGKFCEGKSLDFAFASTNQTLENVNAFLFQERQFGDKKGSLALQLIYIHSRLQALYNEFSQHRDYKSLQALYMETQFGGEKLYTMLGFEACMKAVKSEEFLAAISPKTLRDFEKRCQMIPEFVTVLIRLHSLCPSSIRQELVNKLNRELALSLPSVLAPVHGKDPSKYSGFGVATTFQGRFQRLQFVFSSDEQFSGFATGDKARFCVPDAYLQKRPNARLPYLVHDGMGLQWLLDALLKVLRIPDCKKQTQSKLLFRYLSYGYQALGEEYAIFFREHLQDDKGVKLYTLLEKLAQDTPHSEEQRCHYIVLIAKLCRKFSQESIAGEFLQFASQRLGPSQECGFWRSSIQLLASNLLSFSDWELVCQFTGLLVGMPVVSHLGKQQFSLQPNTLAGEYLSDFNLLQAQEAFVRNYPALKHNDAFLRLVQELLQYNTGDSEKGYDVVPSSPKPSDDVAGYLCNLLQTDATSRLELIRRFPEVVRLSSLPVQHLIARGMKALMEREQRQFPEHFQNGGLQKETLQTDWMEHLLKSPSAEFRRVGTELLLQTPDHERQLTWLLHFAASADEDLTLRILDQHLPVITPADMQKVLVAFPKKAILILKLVSIPWSKWIQLCAEIAPEESFEVYKSLKGQGHARQLLRAICVHGPDRSLNGLVEEVCVVAVANPLDVDWIEAFLRSRVPEKHALGVQQLVQLSGQLPMKKRWIGPILQHNQSVAHALILQVEADCTSVEMQPWLRATVDKVSLMQALCSREKSKWLSICVRVHSDSAFEAYERIYANQEMRAFALPLLCAITNESTSCKLRSWNRHLRDESSIKACSVALLRLIANEVSKEWLDELRTLFQAAAAHIPPEEHKKSLLEFWPILMQPQAMTLSPVFFSRSFDWLNQENYTLVKGQLARFRNGLQALVEQAKAADLPDLCLSILKAHQALCRDHLSDELKKCLLWAVRPNATPAPIITWYLSLLESRTIPPKMETQRQVEILLDLCRKGPVQVSADYLSQLHERLSHDQRASVAEQVEKIDQQNRPLFALFSKKKKEAAPHKEEATPVQNVRTLMNQKRWSDAANALKKMKDDAQGLSKVAVSCIHGLLGMPNCSYRLVFDLLELFEIKDVKWWQKAFLQSHQQLQTPDCVYGVNCLLNLKSKLPNEQQITIWRELFSLGLWLHDGEAKKFFSESSHIVALLGKEELQKYLESIIKAAIPHAPSVYEWFSLLSAKQSNREALAWQVFTEAKMAPDLLSLQGRTDLLEAIGEQLGTHLYRYEAGIRKKPEKKLQKQLLVDYLPKAKVHARDEKVAKGLIVLVEALQKLDSNEVRFFLVEQLYDVPSLPVLESLIPVLHKLLLYLLNKSGFTETDVAHEKLVHSIMEKVLAEGSMEAASKFYSMFFVVDDRNPSKHAPSQIPEENELPPSLHHDRLLEMFSRNYPRYLRGTLDQTKCHLWQAALEVDISLSTYNTKMSRDLVRSRVVDGKKLLIELFLRLLEVNHWDGKNRFLFHHLLHLATSPLLVRYNTKQEGIERSKVVQESYEMSFTAVEYRRFYQASLAQEIVGHEELELELDGNPVAVDVTAIPSCWIDKGFSTMLDSERGYLQFVDNILEVCLHRAKALSSEPLKRARVLDMAAQLLRNIMELYPEEPLIAKYLEELCFSLDGTNAEHCRIIMGLLRLFSLKKIASPDGLFLKRLLFYLHKEEGDLRSQSVQSIEEIKNKAASLLRAESYTDRDLYDLQCQLFNWQDEECLTAFEQRHECLVAIAALWRKQPLVLANELIVRSLDKCLIANTNYFGVDRGAEGQRWATNSAGVVFDCLYDMYQMALKDPLRNLEYSTSSGKVTPIPLPDIRPIMACIDALIDMLRKAKKGHAFETSYEVFAQYAKKIIAILRREPRFAAVQLPKCVTDLTETLCLAVFAKEEILLRCDLLHEYIVGMRQEYLLKVLTPLLKTSIVEEFPLERFEMLVEILSQFSFLQEDTHPFEISKLMGKVKKMLRPVKEPEKRKEYLQKLPEFLRKHFK